MFARTLLGPNQNIAEGFDQGSLAESLLFYGHVDLVLHGGGFQSLIKTVGTENFLRLIEEDFLSFFFLKENVATVTKLGLHNFAVIKMAAMSEQIDCEEDLIFENIFRATDRRGYSKRIARKITEKIKFLDVSNDIFPGGQFTSVVKREAISNDLLQRSIPEIIFELAPNYRLDTGCKLEIVDLKSGLLASSDIDFDKLNSSLKTQGGHLSPAKFLTYFQSSILDIYLSSKFDCSIHTHPINTIFIKNSLLKAVASGGLERSSIEKFQNGILQDGRTVREVINSGERNFSEFFKVLEESQKFKKWISQIDDDQNLLHEYIDSLNSIEKIECLPLKQLRFFITTALGLINPFIGIGVSAVDSFIVDRMLSGWKPSLFINGPMKNFM